MLAVIVADVHERVDAARTSSYFRESMEKILKMTLEEARSGRADAMSRLARTLEPMQALLKRQPWIAGAQPAYADYILFSIFQWARVMSPRRRLLEDPLCAMARARARPARRLRPQRSHRPDARADRQIRDQAPARQGRDRHRLSRGGSFPPDRCRNQGDGKAARPMPTPRGDSCASSRTRPRSPASCATRTSSASSTPASRNQPAATRCVIWSWSWWKATP